MNIGYAIGDVHGNLPALKEVMEKSDYQNNYPLISIGDLVDAYQEGRKVRWIKSTVEFLMQYPNIIFVRGNHDSGFLAWMDDPDSREAKWWYKGMGGHVTLFSYDDNVPESHENFFRKSVPYYLTDTDILFVHAGLPDPDDNVTDVSTYDLLWSRDMIWWSKTSSAKHYRHIYAGHTTTEYFARTTDPTTQHNVTFIDTGAGHRGKLTLVKIDLDTGKMLDYWQA